VLVSHWPVNDALRCIELTFQDVESASMESGGWGGRACGDGGVQDTTNNAIPARWVWVELQGSAKKLNIVYLSTYLHVPHKFQERAAPIGHRHRHVMRICALTTFSYARD